MNKPDNHTNHPAIQPNNDRPLDEGDSPSHTNIELYERDKLLYCKAGKAIIYLNNGKPTSTLFELEGEDICYPTKFPAFSLTSRRRFEKCADRIKVVAVGLQEAFATDVAKFLVHEHRERGWQIAESSELDQTLAEDWEKRLDDWMCEGGAVGPRESEEELRDRQERIRSSTEKLIGQPCKDRNAACQLLSGQWHCNARVLAFYWPKIGRIVEVLRSGKPLSQTEVRSLLRNVVDRGLTRPLFIAPTSLS
jgi:hypothetical protein